MFNYKSYDEVIAAIQSLYNNTTVPPQQTLDDLRGLRDEIEAMIEALEAGADFDE